MSKKLLLISMFVVLVSLSFGGVLSADSGIAPSLTLTVQQSPLAVYPPMMIYTAKLNNWPLPIDNATSIKVDFYRGLVNVNTPMPLIGSAIMDPKTGIAVLNKQMDRGYYVAVAKTVINGISLTSNTVYYKVLWFSLK